MNTKNELNLDQEFKKAFENPIELDLYLKMNSIDQRKEEVRKRWNMTLRIAAITIVLVGISFLFLYIKKSDTSPESIIAEYYSPYPIPDMYRGPESATPSSLHDAVKLYSLAKYPEALIIFDSLLIHDSLNNSLLLYSGICFIETKKYKEATLALRKIILTNDPGYTETAEWYLAMCHLISGEVAGALDILTRLAVNNGIYSKRSEKIIKSLKDN